MFRMLPSPLHSCFHILYLSGRPRPCSHCWRSGLGPDSTSQSGAERKCWMRGLPGMPRWAGGGGGGGNKALSVQTSLLPCRMNSISHRRSFPLQSPLSFPLQICAEILQESKGEFPSLPVYGASILGASVTIPSQLSRLQISNANSKHSPLYP